MYGPSFRWICVPWRSVIASPSAGLASTRRDERERALHVWLELPARVHERERRDRRAGDVVPLDSSRSPVRAEDAPPPSWPHPPSAPCTDASHRAPLSTAVDTVAGAVPGSCVVRWACAQTAAPATRAIDNGTTARRLIRSPFADARASLDDSIGSLAVTASRDAEPPRNGPVRHTVRCNGLGP